MANALRLPPRWILAAGASALIAWRLVGRLREIDLTDRVVLVTGGTRGLGLALARAFAAEGARIVVCSRDRRHVEAAVADLDARGAEGLGLRCDVSDRREVERMVRRVTGRYGRIDVLVNNAGVVQVGPVSAMELRDFEEAMAVNFWGTAHATLAVIPQMRERGSGRIVNITSIGAAVSMPHLLPYSTAKFAALGFSEGLRAELAREGIRVTTVVPGLMRTGGPANASFKGAPDREFTWFSIGDATSLTATSATRAARRIVRATRRGEAYVVLTWQARALRLLHDLFPAGTANLLAMVNRLLPRDEGVRERVPGMRLATATSPSWLTTQMNRAARHLRQYEGKDEPSPEHARRIGLRGERRDGT
jgi:NAD(P)-dependent dehydrogenase (short-subunit alcohol dehydrogenase family)